MKDTRFPHDIKKTVICKDGKTRKEWESFHLMRVHKWDAIDVRLVQKFRAESTPDDFSILLD